MLGLPSSGDPGACEEPQLHRQPARSALPFLSLLCQNSRGCRGPARTPAPLSPAAHGTVGLDPQPPAPTPLGAGGWQPASSLAAAPPGQCTPGSAYLRFPGKQLLVNTEKSLALGGGGGAWPRLHAKGPLLVLIFLIRVELMQPPLTRNHRKVFLFGVDFFLFRGEGKQGTGGFLHVGFVLPAFSFCVFFFRFFFFLLNTLLFASPQRRLLESYGTT